MKKVTVLIANPFSQATSGNDEVMTRLMAAIDRDRFGFIVVQPAQSPYSDAYRKLGAQVVTMSMSIIRRDLSPAFLARYSAGFLPTVYRFASLIRRYGVDVVHTNTTQILGAGAAARLMRVPSLYHVHSVSIEKPEWVSVLMATWIKFTADVLLSNSNASGKILLSRGFPENKLRVLFNPVDLSPYNSYGAREEIRRELGLGDAPLVGLVGRIARIKAIEHFIDAAAIVTRDIPAARFIIVGAPGIQEDFRYLEELQAQAKKLDLDGKLIFAGRRKDVPKIMQALDALALTSVSEGFGLVIAEAFAAGKPVVGSNVGGVPEIIEEGVNGYLVPFGDATALAEKLARLLSDKDRAALMGRAGRDKVERLFSADKLAKQLEAIYLSLTADTRR